MTTLPSRLEVARQQHPLATDAQRVRRIAADLLRDLDVTEPPVDVGMVASMLGIHEVTTDDRLDAAGCLLCRDGRFEIRVRASDPHTRQRFTACHECGHTFFPGYARQTRYRCSPSERPVTGGSSRRKGRGRRGRGIEGLCDIAASELLLPSRLVIPDLRTAPFSFTALGDLAGRYGASLEATGRRFVDGWGREPAVLLALTVRRKPSETGSRAEPRLRLDYTHTSQRSDWPYFLPHKSVQSGEVLHRALTDGDASGRTILRGICAEPVPAEIHARHCPITVDGEPRDRVLAIARRTRT